MTKHKKERAEAIASALSFLDGEDKLPWQNTLSFYKISIAVFLAAIFGYWLCLSTIVSVFFKLLSMYINRKV